MAGKPASLPPLEERLALLMDELSLAARWNSAAILLAVYRSEITLTKTASALRRAIRKAGGSVMELAATPEAHDIPLILRDHPEWSSNTFFITGLDASKSRGYSNAYTALNMHRETLIELHARCIFWITRQELRQLPRLAPDFWAFRHKLVEFTELPARPRSAGSLTDLRRQLRADPQDPELHMRLARYWHKAGCPQDALRHARKAAALAPRNGTAQRLLARLERQSR